MRAPRLLFCALCVLLTACGRPASAPVRLVAAPATVPAPTMTLPPITTTTSGLSLSRPAGPDHPARSAVVPRGTAPLDPGFWRRLANCESRSGASGAFVGYFQLTWANAARVGIGPSSSYDEQVAGAQRWLALISGRGWTTAGWPTCWPIALHG